MSDYAPVNDLIARLFGPDNGPQNALEEYLLTDLSQLHQHNEVLPFVIWRYQSAYVQASHQVRVLEKSLREVRANSLWELRKDVKPNSNKPYSLEEAKELRALDSSVVALERELLVAVKGRDEIQAYLRALQAKTALTPGLQGLWNRIGDEHDE